MLSCVFIKAQSGSSARSRPMTIEQAHKDGIASVHACFERLTSKRYQLHTHRMWCWEKFLVARKLTEADLEIVVKYLQQQIAAKHAYPPQLWFSNLIEQPDRFEEYLGDAKAKARNAPILWTDRDSVLHATGRVTDELKKLVEPPKVISMNDRVRWHLAEMRKMVDGGKAVDD